MLTELTGDKSVNFPCRGAVIQVARDYERVSWVQRNHSSSTPWLWYGDEHMRDQHGRDWARDLHMVCNDFGDLVEVQR